MDNTRAITDLVLFLGDDDTGGSVCVCSCKQCAHGFCGRCEKNGPMHSYSWTEIPDKNGYMLPRYDKYGMLIHYRDEDLKG